jgi:hypothetical protein
VAGCKAIVSLQQHFFYFFYFYFFNVKMISNMFTNAKVEAMGSMQAHFVFFSFEE